MSVAVAREARPLAVRLRSFVESHPGASFFVFAYLYSWSFWAPAALRYDGALGEVAVFVRVWGPAAAGATVTWLLGRSVRDWIEAMLYWWAARRWYLFVLVVPAVIIAVVSVAFLALGEDLDGSLLGERAAMYGPMLIFVTLVGGGNEEWGWRGFALPTLLERYSPVQYCITATTLVVIAVLLGVSRGRLGPQDEQAAAAPVIDLGAADADVADRAPVPHG
ncbi:MAG: type II CAAX prenyl endopeptidase Rce1 family protein [Acidimicrobiales bacterium]